MGRNRADGTAGQERAPGNGIDVSLCYFSILILGLYTLVVPDFFPDSSHATPTAPSLRCLGS